MLPRCQVADPVWCTTQAGTPREFESLEHELLRGQKLQGVLTSNEVRAGRHGRGCCSW